MKKLAYLFVMIAGMTLAAVNVNAQDAKSCSATAKKEATACCKSGEKTADGKTCTKEVAAACASKGTSAAVNDKAGACSKSKTEATVAEAKVTKSVK